MKTAIFPESYVDVFFFFLIILYYWYFFATPSCPDWRDTLIFSHVLAFKSEMHSWTKLSKLLRNLEADSNWVGKLQEVNSMCCKAPKSSAFLCRTLHPENHSTSLYTGILQKPFPNKFRATGNLHGQATARFRRSFGAGALEKVIPVIMLISPRYTTIKICK